MTVKTCQNRTCLQHSEYLYVYCITYIETVLNGYHLIIIFSLHIVELMDAQTQMDGNLSIYDLRFSLRRSILVY